MPRKFFTPKEYAVAFPDAPRRPDAREYVVFDGYMLSERGKVMWIADKIAHERGLLAIETARIEQGRYGMVFHLALCPDLFARYHSSP